MFQQTKALQLLRDGFKQEFAIKVFESEGFTDLLMELSSDFVEENIPIEDEDLKLEMAMLLMESIQLGNY